MKLIFIALLTLFISADTYHVIGVKKGFAGNFERQSMKIKAVSNYGYETLTVKACKNSYGWSEVYYGSVTKVGSFDEMSEDYEYETNACGGTTYFNY